MKPVAHGYKSDNNPLGIIKASNFCFAFPVMTVYNISDGICGMQLLTLALILASATTLLMLLYCTVLCYDET